MAANQSSKAFVTPEVEHGRITAELNEIGTIALSVKHLGTEVIMNSGDSGRCARAGVALEALAEKIGFLSDIISERLGGPIVCGDFVDWCRAQGEDEAEVLAGIARSRQ